ncbi:putative 7-carboxy-7-deazaguanine synthase QueE [Clostridium cellulovorans]|uniref:7-carboxy-7-deazaguanine synthase n=1 Tax=Clostridium cellulovorans (strain ATCC 35296 / DSM 3052 / OCM 3 / 743B) TaxID=573061 RepID=D9SMJ4_CLOC7|nr:putative 7-carboxy-7-deazaguanine synthase QueE [Clostridium cellulovorans]ADL53850.1 Radical SAM domain protein [Clostridium cellulovorans 743B]
MYKVVEKFVSINGEGLRAGELAVFIRFLGCNLKCSYCDTKWANEPECPYELMSGEEIYAYIKETGVRNVTLTGGEPLIQKEMKELIDLLLKDGLLRIEIETNGSVDVQQINYSSERVSITLDYKGKSSLMEGYMKRDSFKLLTKKDSVKFVVGDNEDLERALSFIKECELLEKTNVLFSCIFDKIQPAEVVEFMKNNKLIEARIQLQLHKYIWGPTVKGV